MSIDIKGTVTHIGDTQTIGGKGFQKRCFVLKTEDQYPQELEIEATKERIQQLDSMNIGDVVTAAVNLKGRRWDGPQGTKYFVSLEVWRLNVDSKAARPAASGGFNSGGDLPF